MGASTEVSVGDSEGRGSVVDSALVSEGRGSVSAVSVERATHRPCWQRKRPGQSWVAVQIVWLGFSVIGPHPPRDTKVKAIARNSQIGRRSMVLRSPEQVEESDKIQTCRARACIRSEKDGYKTPSFGAWTVFCEAYDRNV